MTFNTFEETILTVDKPLYKYQSFSKRSESFVIDRKIYFSSRKSFNDPFDCRADFSSVRGLKKEVLPGSRSRLLETNHERGQS
jgi:hypothetical protein